MTQGTNSGGRAGQLLPLVGLTIYCLKSYNIPMKIVGGFLYVYWSNHLTTLGSYCGAFAKTPKAYRVVSNYCQNRKQHPNILDKL
jgi:hypothetical protein